MANINRWTPGRLSPWDRDLFDEMDRVFSEPFFGRRWDNERTSNWGLPLDVSEREDKYIVRASIPGINPDNIDLSISDNMLTIRGNMSQSSDDESENYVLRERRMGNFTRSVTFPTAIDANAAEASCEHGVLTIQLPKAATARPRRISIGGGAPGRQTIEAQSGMGQTQTTTGTTGTAARMNQTSNGDQTQSGRAAGSEGWPEGQARPGRPSTETNRQSQHWTEGQGTTAGEPKSEGWVEGQGTTANEPKSEGWTEGMDNTQS
ncbi:MAG TPA: Hsp20/alpha crystallin family protein [Promineifilum sp.]|nr:Hsp20/alpha crystallin family protein [Promineifilum sp.]